MKIAVLLATIGYAGAFTFQAVSNGGMRRSFALRLASHNDQNLHKGKVKFFDSKKGYGFILPDDDSEADVFAHQQNIHMDGFRFLSSGETVHYRKSTRDDGKIYASEIYKIGSAEDLAQVSEELGDAVREATLMEADAIAAAMEADEVAESIEAATHDESTMTLESAKEVAEVEKKAIAEEEAAADLAAHVLPVMAVEEIAQKLEEERQNTEEEQKVAAASSSKNNPDPFHHVKTLFKF